MLLLLISDHVQSGTEIYIWILLHDTISDKILYDVDVSCKLSTWSYAIIFQFDGALVILIENIVIDIVSLLFQEVSGPDHLG